MRLYQLKYDDQFYYVEAETMGKAILAWESHQVAKYPGEEWEGLEPEGVTEIHDEPVIR